eukprot:CAMPEP_0204370338 /NCGR_PEP_ID=MMETSP0469-20131031/45669_1 /ASSEMBLY_ACC=CAM_ASM_000384 /TAXON_ID=2969 /ORGANISM="Oxyrrhis marina" /LENGTH=56 /DNA_ID=CAMNT_0051360249 /DNA_START=82 /DNA_END=249 /DNA_ORIENTATION=+
MRRTNFVSQELLGGVVENLSGGVSRWRTTSVAMPGVQARVVEREPQVQGWASMDSA